MRIGQAIRNWRRLLHISGKTLAAKAGISASYLSLLETGNRDPSLSTLVSIARVLGTPVSQLILLAEKIEGTMMEMERLEAQMKTASSFALKGKSQ